jgi:hypothetical protein
MDYIERHALRQVLRRESIHASRLPAWHIRYSLDKSGKIRAASERGIVRGLAKRFFDRL